MEQKIIDRLVQLRRERKLSQEEVADRLFVSRQAVSKWERGESLPDTSNLIGLAKLYNLSIDELLFGMNRVPTFEDAQLEEQIIQEAIIENIDGTVVDGAAAVKEETVPVLVVVDEQINAAPGQNLVFDEVEIVQGEGSGDEESPLEEEEEEEEEEEGGESFYQSSQWKEMEAKEQDEKDRKTVPYPLLVTIIYLILGFGWNLWHPGWMVFLTIPLHGFKKQDEPWRTYLASPVMITIIYLLLGFYFHLWHPGWMIFLCIPFFQRFAK